MELSPDKFEIFPSLIIPSYDEYKSKSPLSPTIGKSSAVILSAALTAPNVRIARKMILTIKYPFNFKTKSPYKFELTCQKMFNNILMYLIKLYLKVFTLK